MKKSINAAFAVLLMICACSCTKENIATTNNASQSATTDYAVKTGSILGRQQVIELQTGDYYYPTSQALLWLPKNYDSVKFAKNHYPLIIALGGIGQNGSTDITNLLGSETVARRIADGWDGDAVNPLTGKTHHFIVFSPEKSEPNSWGWSAPAIKKMLGELEAQYRINPDRVYITGLSAGGWGMWSCVTDDTTLCKQFAAIGPVSSAGADHPDKIPNVDKFGLACWNICGTADSFYSLAVSYTGIINSNKPAINPVLTGLNGVGHSAWYYAYDPNWTQNGINFYQWLLQYKKNK